MCHTKITIKYKNREVELSVEEAKELHSQLSVLFGSYWIQYEHPQWPYITLSDKVTCKPSTGYVHQTTTSEPIFGD